MALRDEQVIAYPTEAVFGLGCDPDSQKAVAALHTLKQRSEDRGLILVAADYQQLLPYVDDTRLTSAQRSNVLARWPGPTTWILPISLTTPRWLTGRFDMLAVRVSAHPLVRQLCRAFGKPITSTSANLSGSLPARSLQAVRSQFGVKLPILPGEVGGQMNPSEILDALTHQCIRQG